MIFLPGLSFRPLQRMSAPQPEVAQKSADAAYTPNDFVNKIVGRPVIVKLNSGITYHGVLACLDGFMNLALEQTEEYVDGQLKNKYGDCFIRGNNGEFVWKHRQQPGVMSTWRCG